MDENKSVEIIYLARDDRNQKIDLNTLPFDRTTIDRAEGIPRQPPDSMPTHIRYWNERRKIAHEMRKVNGRGRRRCRPKECKTIRFRFNVSKWGCESIKMSLTLGVLFLCRKPCARQTVVPQFVAHRLTTLRIADSLFGFWRISTVEVRKRRWIALQNGK